MRRIEIHVNGEPKTIEGGCTVASLLTDLGLDGHMVVVELNRQILKRTELSHITLEAGDRIELVHFVGGG